MSDEREVMEASVEAFLRRLEDGQDVRDAMVRALAGLDSLIHHVEIGHLPSIPTMATCVAVKVHFMPLMALYDKLGPRAVEAIMRGEAACFHIHPGGLGRRLDTSDGDAT